ncbi:MAG: tRNA (adenosine(37)-N6)-threonylcarbamoyltransferase complex ATPase subunit type 1 TsaE [Clostridia bacterium]|nr:tRNA (adenosine(37)-N6)-threonylcarbamoyltransferase complex ATPase subunit type 1 TsaE [Clostridia bacterium]
MDKTVKENSAILTYYSHSIDDTAYLAQKIADRLKGGEVILLNGQLGAGKTAFTKCLAKSLGVVEEVTSPTFAFMKEYQGKFPLYHFDLYRVGDEDELYELGLSEYLYSGGVCVIEWNKFEEVQNPIVIDISIPDNASGDEDRKFVVKGVNLEF